MLSALNDSNADYMIVGAYAMAAHGCPQATGDIDIWVRSNSKNSRNVWKALLQFGAPTSGITEDDFAEPNVVYQIGLPPQRIELLTEIDGVTFSEAWPNRLVVAVDGIALPVIGLADLRKNKAATGRDKDQRDLKLLDDHAV
ncbi:MAG: hypothetical protein AAGA03_08150 [Planctomycetota bacterium]